MHITNEVWRTNQHDENLKLKYKLKWDSQQSVKHVPGYMAEL